MPAQLVLSPAGRSGFGRRAAGGRLRDQRAEPSLARVERRREAPGAVLGVAHQLRDVLAQALERRALRRERRVALARAPLEEQADAGDRPTVEDGRGEEQRLHGSPYAMTSPRPGARRGVSASSADA